MKKMRLPLVILTLLMAFGITDLSLNRCSHDGDGNREMPADTVAPTSQEMPAAYDADSLSDADSTYYSYEADPVAIPPFVTHWVGGMACTAETLCVAKGQTYYQAYTNNMLTNILYSDRKVVVDAPSLYFHLPDSAAPSKYIANIMDREVPVDFASKASVRRLTAYGSVLPSFTRFRMDSVGGLHDNVLFAIEMDFPSGHSKHEQDIKHWLADRLFIGESDVEAFKPYYINSSQAGSKFWRYRDDVNDVQRIANFAAAVYFSGVKETYGSDSTDYPLMLYRAQSYRARVSNSRYVTYQVYTNEYSNGLHGYYTERLLTYDTEHQKEVDWDYLFTPDSKEQIEEQVFKKAMSDVRFSYCFENDSSLADSLVAVREHIKSWYEQFSSPGSFPLPQPALAEQGVVFSFQPYEIGSFAAGTFHFTIPYSLLRPYLTDHGRWLLGM